MKIIGILLWIFLAGALSAETGEKLALTVHVLIADPGEEAHEWTDTYFIDPQGWLARIDRLVRGWDEPDKLAVTRFFWESGRVKWKSVSGDKSSQGTILFQPGSVVELEGTQERLEWVSPFLGAWSDGQYRYDWTASGYSATLIDTKGSIAQQSPKEFSTQGSRLTALLEGRQWEFSLLDRRPRALVATTYGVFADDGTWAPFQTITVEGPGLWTDDEVVRMVHAFLARKWFVLPVWPAFVFEKNYLK